MYKWLFFIVAFFSVGFACLKAEEVKKPVSLIPFPVSLSEGEGVFVFSEKTVVALEDKSLEKVVKDFLEQFENAAGFLPKIKVKSKKGNVRFLIDETIREEGYHLSIEEDKIVVKVASEKGAFYALQTIRQLLPLAIEKKKEAKVAEWSLPVVDIVDEPRFAYRGLMVDVARYFMGKEQLFRVIDTMGMLKLNKLHLHLTDNNGWRLEIKQYPLLTEVGAQTVDRPNQVFPERRNARQGEPTRDGGFYTQEDIREIIAYASARQIEVIPEIAMPGHANAALAAYPLLACTSVDKYIGVVPGLGGGHKDILFCAGNDDVFTFLEHVIDEVVELFPSQYIHVGGDAASKVHWEKCPMCRKRMKAENLLSGKDLLGYFMRRVDSYVRSKGKTLMGWEEVMDANLSKGAVVFDWHGFGHGAMKAGEQGHHFVMSPTGRMYLNHYQGPQWQEQVLSFEGMNTLENIYYYEPVERYWTMSMRSLVMGMQAALWTEFCEKPEDVDYLLYPRLAAVSEAAWSFPISKNWERFLETLDDYEERWIVKGITPSRSIYNVYHEVVPDFGKLKVSLKCIHPGVEIRYTTDGKEPHAYANLYRRPWQLKESTTIKCATFKNGKQMGKTLEIPVSMNSITGKNLLRGNPVERRILNGVRGSLKSTDGEWASWTRNDSISLTFDVGSRKKLARVSLGCLNDFGLGLHKPEKIEVWLSDNDVLYWKMGEKRYKKDEIFREGRFVEDLTVEFEDAARYVRVILYGAGPCPEGHVRPGREARVFLDEAFIE